MQRGLSSYFEPIILTPEIKLFPLSLGLSYSHHPLSLSYSHHPLSQHSLSQTPGYQSDPLGYTGREKEEMGKSDTIENPGGI